MAFGESKGRHLAGNLTRQGKPILLDSAQLNVQLTESNNVLDSAEILAIPGLGSIDSADVLTISAPLTNRNMIINGAMAVNQRGGVPAAGAHQTFPVDRFKIQSDNDGVVAATQSTDVPANKGFTHSMKFDVTTADTSIGAGQYYHIFQAIEGHNAARLRWGTASAKAAVASFWVKSSKTGTHNFVVFNTAGDRFFNSDYTVSSADTWEHKTITVAADTGGTWNTNNLASVYVSWYLALGSTYDDGTSDGAWGSADYGTGSQVNLLDNTSNEFYLTGVQFEIGSSATEFEHEDFQVTMTKCKRYYQRYNRQANYAGLGLAVPWSTTNGNIPFFLEVEPRANPTVEYNNLNQFDYFGVTGTGSTGNPTALTNSGWSGGNNLDIGLTGSGFVSARAMLVEFNATGSDAYIAFSSEY